MPPCGIRSGCLRIVNEHGRSHPLPSADAAWGTEESLDLDMVSAICPRCRILLVEAEFALAPNLGRAVRTAAAMGAKYISNSWGGPELAGQDVSDHVTSGVNGRCEAERQYLCHGEPGYDGPTGSAPRTGPPRSPTGAGTGSR